MLEGELDRLWADSSGDQETLTVSTARERAKEDPKRYRAAVVEGDRCILFKRVKDAEKHYGDRVRLLIGQGYKKKRWGVSFNVTVLASPEGEELVVSLDKRQQLQ